MRHRAAKHRPLQQGLAASVDRPAGAGRDFIQPAETPTASWSVGPSSDRRSPARPGMAHVKARLDRSRPVRQPKRARYPQDSLAVYRPHMRSPLVCLHLMVQKVYGFPIVRRIPEPLRTLPVYPGATDSSAILKRVLGRHDPHTDRAWFGRGNGG